MFRKSLSFLLLLISAMSFNACSSDDENQVTIERDGIFINEVYASSGDDWIEIYNSNSTEVDLSGYKIYDDPANKYPLPEGTTLGPNQFLVLICDDLGSGLHPSFKLSSTGETLTLEKAQGGTASDQVTYPELNNGDSFGRYPDGSENYQASGAPTPGSSNGGQAAPLVQAVTRNPIVVTPGSSVTVSADVLSATSLESVKLFYRFGSGSFTPVSMTVATGSRYSAVIPAQPNEGRVDYYIEAKNTTGEISRDPAGAPSSSRFFVTSSASLPNLKINEFMAMNTSCCPDEQATDEFDDWIEIYNAGSEPVDIGGMFVSDNSENPFKYQIPADQPGETTIPAGGFLLIWADETGSQGPLHANFRLSAAGESVGIYFIDGRTIDLYSYGLQQENVSMGRQTDGAATWKSFSNPTPGQSNN